VNASLRTALALLGLLVALGTVYLLTSGERQREAGMDRAPVEPSGPALSGSTAPGIGTIVHPVAELEPPRTLLADETYDITGDGAPERILLYVDAPRGPDGRLQWDDGQRWALLVRAGGAVYPLFDERVQIGRLRFWIIAPSDPEAGEAVRVLLLQETGAGIELRTFRFQEGVGFLATVEHSVSGNVVFTSPDIR
jgi:hypothetical protein